MFEFGEKVIINDTSLKSHNKMGLFVGINSKGQAKVYLEEPLVCNKTTIACITIAPEKLRRYMESERDRIIERLNFLTRRSTELESEMRAIDDETFNLELKLMNIGGGLTNPQFCNIIKLQTRKGQKDCANKKEKERSL